MGESMICVKKDVCQKKKLVNVSALFTEGQKKMELGENGGQIKYQQDGIGVMSANRTT